MVVSPEQNNHQFMQEGFRTSTTINGGQHGQTGATQHVKSGQQLSEMSSQNPLRPIDGDVIIPKSIQIISYQKKTDQTKSRSSQHKVSSAIIGARRESINLNLDLPESPAQETHPPLPITHSEDYYHYLRHTDNNFISTQNRKAHIQSHSNTRQKLDSRQRDPARQAQSVLGSQKMSSDANTNGEDQVGERLSQTMMIYSPNQVRAQSTLVQDKTISSNPLGSLDTGFNDAFGRQTYQNWGRQAVFQDFVAKQQSISKPGSSIAGERPSQGRSTASYNYRRQFREQGYDPRSKMTAILSRDPKNITEMLQYRDYALESALRERTTKSKQGMQAVTVREKVPNHNYSKSTVNYHGRLVETQRLEEPTDQDTRVIKNSFHPKNNKDRLALGGVVKPRAVLQIPETLKKAFNKRGREDSFTQLLQNAHNQSVNSPQARTQSIFTNEVDPSVLNRSIIEPQTTKNEKEYVIKNYRLVYQKKKEFFLPQVSSAQLSPLRQQSLTPQEGNLLPGIFSPQQLIRVSNSILSPNTFHFSTKVTLGRKLQKEIQEVPTIQSEGTLKETPSIITAELQQMSEEPILPQQQYTPPKQSEPTLATLLRLHKSPQHQSSSVEKSKQNESPKFPDIIVEESAAKEEASPQPSIMINPQPVIDDSKLDLKLNPTESDQIGELVLEPEEPAYLKIELDNVPLKILDSRRTDAELRTTERMDLIEQNFRDLVQSWVSQGPIYDTINPDEYVESDDEDYDLQQMSKQISEARLYDLENSVDSLEIEKKMISSMLTHKEQIRSQADDLILQNEVIKLPQEPYAHLKARNVLTEQMKVYNKQIELTMQCHDTRSKAKILIELSNEFLTHLDYSNFHIDRLPLEIFDDFLLEADTFKERIIKRKEENKEPMKALTPYFRTDGTIEEVVCNVHSYDDTRRKFLIDFKADGKQFKKYLGRLNLIFEDYDSRESILERRALAIKLRRNTLFKLNAERLFIKELARKFDFIKMPSEIKDNIKKRLGNVNLATQDRRRVEVVTLQVEALFVFSILKSIVYSQIGDPYISRIVAQYKIEELTVTKKEFNDEVADYHPQVPYYALKAYEEKQGKLEKMLNRKEAKLILEQYSILGKKAYIDVIQYMIKLNLEMIVASPMFLFPITDRGMYINLQTHEEFRGKTLEELADRLSECPVQIHNFVKSQKVIAKRFKDMLETRWTESIARKVEQFIGSEFEAVSYGKEIMRSQLNPYLVKLFEFIRMNQERVLLDKLMQTTEDYLKFLLSFAIRDRNFTQSKCYQQGDFEHLKIKMSSRPMIIIEVRIKRSLAGKEDQQMDSGKYTYEIQTRPSLNDIWGDLMVMVDMFVSSVSKVRRVDTMVIPLLKMKKNTLMQFDKGKNPEILNQIKVITQVIEVMRSLPDLRMEQLKTYQPYLEMNFEALILDLKMKTYEELNQHNSQDLAGGFGAGIEDEHQEAHDEPLDVEAYKDIEISERVFIQTFADLRKSYWDVQLDIDSQNDYGMIVLDCSNFKKMVAKHLETLLRLLQDFILKEFLLKMNHLFGQYDTVEKRIMEKVTTIDEVILLLEFIESIQRQEDLLDDLESQLDELKVRKNFIDELFLKLENSDYERYLHLFYFPSKLRILLIKRKFSLESEREFLSGQMQEEKDRVLKAIISYRECFEFFKNVGLYTPGKTNQRFPTESPAIVHENPVDLGVPSSNQVVQAIKTIVNKKKINEAQKKQQEAERRRLMIMSMTDDQGNQFVPQYITENSARMEKFKQDLDQTELDCEIINRREKLLNFRQTKFTAVSNLKTDMAPFITLWSIAQSFTKTYESWLYGLFSELDSDKMEELTIEWIKQLTRVSKTNVSTYPTPMTLVNYLLRELERYKEYLPMIAAMRAKGLEKRHWQQMTRQLDQDNLETNNLTLAHLIEMRLFEGPKLEMIKTVSDIAMKEWAIKTTLDSLEGELRVVEFTVNKYKEPAVAYVLKGLDELIGIFEDFVIKTVSLRQNQFAKVFSERILKIEKEFKMIVDVLEEWIKTQKAWIYLEPIFSQKDLAEQMRNESVKFAQVDAFYKKEINLIQQDPNVHRYCRREIILTSLQYANKEFDVITKGLTVYLETKRGHFSRFYFLSNEEIIEILGQIRDPKNVQKFLNKIFEGIESLSFSQTGMVTSLISKEEEYLPLKRQVDPTQNAETWLKELEGKMKEAVKTVIENAYADYRLKDLESWVKTWQGQAVMVVLSIILTEILTEIFHKSQFRRLKDVLNQIVFEIETLTRLIRTKIDQNVRTSICSLLTNRVHARDTLKNMVDSDARFAQDFSWKLYMKYEYALIPKKSLLEELRRPLGSANDQEYFQMEQNERPQGSIVSSFGGYGKGQSTVKNNDEDPAESIQDLKQLCVSIIDARKTYGYEYLGNSQRLVITPLTDRCFRALFMALHFNYGGSPEGPVGTGKTETTKDLSKCLGKQCFVFNCSSSLNYENMSKFFKGLATCGAWSCFDEFNRIELSVLSVISQIIIVMQGAIRESRTEMVFEDTKIKFNKECAIFITMNPQFLGRTDLPDNLKSLFRPVAMIIPDSTLISEISLYCYGFLQAKPLARKLVRAFKLAKQQLSSQVHYEFGLRSIKIVLQIAGLMKLKASGVIEPEFKFKEGKKRVTSMSLGDHSQVLSLKSGPDSFLRKSLDQRLSRNDRAAYLNYRLKHEPSLDTSDCIRRKRQPSIDSEEFNINDDIMLRDSEAPLPGRPKVEDAQKFERELREKEARHPDERIKRLRINHHQVSWVGIERHAGHKRRKQLARGNIIGKMVKRVETVQEYKDEAKQTKKLMKVLGIDDIELIKNEEKIEEFIVLRSINDTNVPKLHQNDTLIFKGIIDDIFPNPIRQSVERNSLKSLLDEVIATKQIQLTDEITERILHLSETVMIRHGVMVVGSTMTGKTTIIQLLQECLNKSRENELESRIQEYKIKKLKKQQQNNRSPYQEEQDFDMMVGRSIEDQTKSIDLSQDEIKQIKSQCRNKGVATFTMNPKCLSLDQLMGYHDEISKDWHDGIMAHAMRVCAQDTSERRNWIIFDGPIDPDWVENLNSVLDDNKKLTLSTGECIKLTSLMTVILEAEDLTNSTPATISRCGMIYLRDEILPLKGILNQWMNKLPQFLEDMKEEVDRMCNYFIPEILEKYMIQANLIYPVTRKWAIKNFCRMMDSLLADYRSEKFNQLSSMTSAQLAVYLNPPPGGYAGAHHNMRNSLDGGVKATETVQTVTTNFGGGSGKRPFYMSYADIEARFQNALRNKQMWLQNFFLFSLLWSFGSILKLELRSEFNQHLKGKIVFNTEEINTVAQLKGKFGLAKKGAPLAQNRGNRNQGRLQTDTDQKMTYIATHDFKEPEKVPYFYCSIPEGPSLFDLYFDLEANQWCEWENLRGITRPASQDDHGDQGAFKKFGTIFTKFIHTTETIRLGYLVESSIIAKSNLVLIGHTGCGKSWLVREMMFKQIPLISQRFKTFSMVFSNGSNAEKAQNFIDSRVEKRRRGVYGPPLSNRYVFFIDDLMMPFKDRFGTQSANELLRQWFDFSGWYDTKNLEFKRIDDIQFISCITTYDSGKSVISTRNEWHWSYIGAISMDEKHYVSMFTQILDQYALSWPPMVQGQPLKNCVKATLDLYEFFEKSIKPTPSKFLYYFNIRHMFKIMYGIAEVDPSYLISEFNFGKLWLHEAWRTLCDRICENRDAKKIHKKMREIAHKYFDAGKDRQYSKDRGKPFFTYFNKGSEGLYLEAQSWSETVSYLKRFLYDYNEMHKKQKINVVLFDTMIEFILKVLRIIKQPFSHGIMIGIEGSGKEALCRLATALANQQYHSIKFDANYSPDDWQNDLKKLLLIAGIEMREVVFHLKHNQIISEQFLDDLNTLVNNGEVQNVFSKEEYENIIVQVSTRLANLHKKTTLEPSPNVHHSSQNPIEGAQEENPDAGKSDNKVLNVNTQIALGDFSQKCRENLKVILNFTPTGANLRQRLRDHKQLLNCSTVIWMEKWPTEGYKEVAELLLPIHDEEDINHFELLKDKSLYKRDDVVNIAMRIHQDAISVSKDYFFESQHYLHITPQLFQDFLQTYKVLYVDKTHNLTDIRQRYEVGLDRLKTTQEKVEKFSEQLESNSPLLIDKQIEVERMLEKIRDDHENLGRMKDMLMQEDQLFVVQREQAESIRQECEINLQRATPELYAAIASLQNLSKYDLNELKSLRNPPTAVKLLMECVVLILGLEPVKTKAKDGVTIEKDYWTVAVGKQVLGNPRIIEILSHFDSTTVTSNTMARLEEIAQANIEILTASNLENASKAAKGLFLWLQAVKNYYYVYQETIPKRDALFQSEKQLQDKEREIKAKREEITQLQKNLDILRDRHKTLQKEIQVLQREIDECSVKKDRAGKLLNGLGGEKQKWLVCNRMIDKRFVSIQGDVLMGAAFITYLSPFTQKFRERTVERWTDMISAQGIAIQDNFAFNKIFGDPIKIKEWNFNGLPSDSFSIQNAIVIEKSPKQAICIDPQYQANKWIKFQEANNLKVLNFGDNNFIQNLEFAIKFGKRVLIENIGEKVDLVLYPLIKRDFQAEAGQTTVTIFGHTVEVDQNFKLFILSELKSPRFGPDISVLTTQVNFHVTIEGLEEQMLSIVISSQKSELEEESIKMRKEALQCIKILKKLEEEILDSLSQDIDTILNDAKLIETLQTSKKTSRQIGENLNKVNKAQAILLKSRGIYTPAAYRAALLYFLVSDISKIEYMYQFSLKWYIEIFTEEVNLKKTTDQDPLLDIIRNFTFTFYRKVCQSIFEKDKLLFTLLLAFRVLQGEKCLNEQLFEFFLKGFQLQADIQDDEVDDIINMNGDLKEKKASTHIILTEQDALRERRKELTWITDMQWSTLERLSKIPPFNEPNLLHHIIDNQDQWYAYANAKDGDNVPMPGGYLEYDPVKKEKLLKKLKKQQEDEERAARRQGQPTTAKIHLSKVAEVPDSDEDETQQVLEDEQLWELDQDEDGEVRSARDERVNQSGDEEEYVDDRDQIADSIVMGVSDYQEVRYGSVRFEREQLNKKQQVLKDLIKFCIIRIFTPEKIVREIQRFLGSVLDPRFMEPPVFNLAQFFQESTQHTPILFIQSSNTNVLNELNILKLQIQEPNINIEYLPLGGNVGEKVTQLIIKCAKNGSWLLLENLHLVTNWIPTLEKFLHEMNREDKKGAPKQNPIIGPTKKAISKLISQKDPMVVLPSQINQSNNFPELNGIKINPKFRLWLSSMPVDYFPVSFIQDCVKLTLQPAQGIRQNALKLFNSTNVDYLQRCPLRQAEFRKLYFSLTVFHAVVVERQRFGPLGFSGHAYHFSENDFIISSLQLQYLISKVNSQDDPLPLDLARYLIGTLNYGGRIVKQQDEITLNAILDTFINEKTYNEAQYRLTGIDNASEQGIYYIPGEGDIGHYKQFIIKFPVQDRAEIFGLHKNAIVQRMSNEGKNLLERVFEFEFASKEVMKASAILESNDATVGEDSNKQTEDGNAQSEDKAASFKKRIARIIKELPDLLDQEACARMYPISYEHCFNILIKKEVERYNTLMQVIYITLKNTLKALEGVMHINPQLEEVYRSLTYEHVPLQWFRYSYPGFKSLALYLTNLKERVEFIRGFLTTERQLEKENQLHDYWLPGFFDQSGFFTTLLQQKARNDKISIEVLAIEFTPIKPKDMQIVHQSGAGCLINGLWLEAARWQDIDESVGDKEPITLQDSNDSYGMSLYQLMPHFQLTVINQADFDAKYMTDKYYQCPLYMIGLRDRLESGIGADTAAFSNSMIIKVPLYIGSSGISGAKGNAMRQPGFWIKRGTALLCQKED